jgi:hypothetical protein
MSKAVAILIALVVVAAWLGPGLMQAVAGKRVVLHFANSPANPVAQAAPAGDAEQWSVDLAAALGNPAPSRELIALLVAWQRAEGSKAEFNPLATTQDMPGATCFNTDPCVKNYLSREDGLLATALTLTGTHAGYDQIVAGIQSNDADLILDGLAAGAWGTSAALTAEVFEEELDAIAAAPAPQVSGNSPIAVDGSDFGHNIRVALEANGGALKDVTIAPGETWSFNAAMGDPELIDYVNVSGVDGGGWCDLAARFIQAARPIVGAGGLVYQHHGIQLNGVSWQDSVAIWNNDGTPGFEDGAQDLLITNTTSGVLRFLVSSAGDGFVTVAAVQ